MTRNQIEYLNLEETKRNNLVTAAENERSHRAQESLQGQQNAETKRNNLYVGTEQKRHNKATERLTKRGQNVSAKTNISVANTQAASKDYATDVNAALGYANQANQRAIATQNNQTTQNVAELKAKTDKFLKSVDKLMKNKELTQKERESLRKYYSELERAYATIDKDMSVAELRTLEGLLKSPGGWFYMLGKSTSSSKKSSGVDRAVSNTTKNAQKAGAQRSKEIQSKYGSKTATYRTLSDGSKVSNAVSKTDRAARAKQIALRTNTAKKKAQKNKNSGASYVKANGDLVIKTNPKTRKTIGQKKTTKKKK